MACAIVDRVMDLEYCRPSATSMTFSKHSAIERNAICRLGLSSATGRLHCGWIPKSKFKRSCAFRLARGRREGSLNDGSSKHTYGGALFVNDQIIQGTNISERRGTQWRILLLGAVGCVCVCLGIP